MANGSYNDTIEVFKSVQQNLIVSRLGGMAKLLVLDNLWLAVTLLLPSARPKACPHRTSTPRPELTGPTSYSGCFDLSDGMS